VGEGGERDEGNKNREGGMEIHKPREKEKGISERGNNNARMGRGLHETVGREKEGRKSRKRNEEEADGARGNRGRLKMTKCCKSVINNILGDLRIVATSVAMTLARGEVTRLSPQDPLHPTNRKFLESRLNVSTSKFAS
jgi:hypothetical protein